MTHKVYTLLSIILLLILCSFTTNHVNQGKRKISNKQYSITLPSDWKPAQHMQGDGTVPAERTEQKGLYHLSWLQWSSISEDFYKRISIYIQGYTRKDGTPLSINDVETLNMKDHKEPGAKDAKRTDLKAKANQKRYMVAKEERVLSGKYHKVRNFCLIEKSKGSVYLLNLALEEDVYQKPGVPKMINEILDSFILNNK